MDAEEDDLGSADALGLHRVLASAGIDTNAFSNFFSKTGGKATTSFADVDADDNEDKFEDDVSDLGLPEESEEVKKAREEEKAAEARWYRRALAMQAEVGQGEEERKKRRKEKELNEVDELKRVWPGFEKGQRLSMVEVFYDTPMMRRDWAIALGKKKRRKLETQTYTVKVAPDHRPDPQSSFQLSSLPAITVTDPEKPIYETPLGSNFDPAWIKGAKSLLRKNMRMPPNGLSYTFADFSPALSNEDGGGLHEAPGRTLDLGNWEKDIIMCSLDTQPKTPFDPLAPRNDFLDSGDWIKDVIWDARRVSPGLLESDDDLPAPPKAGFKTADPTSKLDPFNLSNDHIYEHAREGRQRIRQTFGEIEVFHSQPAKNLQMPYYKATFTKAETRAWRRPALQFATGITYSFSKLRSNPSASVSSKKKAMQVDPSERFKSTKDLTMSEKCTFALLEFSEEYPPIMSGYGMGTTIVNYYRKKDEKDETVPTPDFGQPSILNVGDAEPFLLGYVDRGAVTQVLHNNLIRAPLFKHQPETTDFLVVRHTVNNHTTYHLRLIANIFTVGQTLPNESEIGGPHARKNTNTAKMRLMIVAWLLIQKSKLKRMKMSKLLKYFPEQTELQMRQRLKIKGNEFLEYSRQPSPNQGYWTLNPNYDFPSDRQSVLAQCSPESAMLFEAMLAGQRHLYDAGYKKTAEGTTDEDAGDEAGLDIEQQLAVWSTSANYKKAEAQKAWLLIHGEGDPTGRGEGVSFLTTNMKGYFLRRGETEQGRRLESEAKAAGNPVKISNTEQNRIYEEEKRRVWDLQWKALSDPIPPTLAPDEDRDQSVMNSSAMGPRFARSDSKHAFSRGNSKANTPWAESPRDQSPGAFSGDGESTYTGNPNAGKVLRIKRMVKGKIVTDIVRDPAVINAYLRRVEEEKLEQYQRQAEELQPTGNHEEDQLRRAALMQELDKIKRNQARRLARKKYQSNKLEEVEEGAESGKRKCGACGLVGHTKANRNCPMYAQTYANSIGPSPTTTPGGYGLPGSGYVPSPAEGMMAPPESPAGGAGGGTSFKIRLGAGQR